MNNVDRESVEAIREAVRRFHPDDVDEDKVFLLSLLDTEGEAKDGAYDERNRLVAMLASLFPASLERHPDEDAEWENDWRWIVFIDLPTGQASWHIHDSQLSMFGHLKRMQGRKWDGHTNEQKWDRVAKLASSEKDESPGFSTYMCGWRDAVEAAAKHVEKNIGGLCEQCNAEDKDDECVAPTIAAIIRKLEPQSFKLHECSCDGCEKSKL